MAALDYWFKKDLADIDSRYVVKLSDETLLHVAADQDGRVVRLKQRGSAQHTWIALSDNTWRYLSKIRETINNTSATFSTKTDIFNTTCTTQYVYATHQHGNATVVIKETTTGGSCTKRIDLSNQELQNFPTVSTIIDDCVNDITVHSSFEDDWHILKRSCGAFSLCYRLVPKLPDSVISTLLSAHLVTQAIAKCVREACIGYGMTFPSQKQHTSLNCVCLTGWNEQAEQYFDDVKDTIEVKSAAKKVSEVMNWKLQPTPINNELRKLVVNGIPGEVVKIYIKLFEALGLYRLS